MTSNNDIENIKTLNELIETAQNAGLPGEVLLSYTRAVQAGKSIADAAPIALGEWDLL